MVAEDAVTVSLDAGLGGGVHALAASVARPTTTIATFLKENALPAPPM
ncbi:MAG: hypothetical protein M5U19_18340 [Microthrixaceae bacterium]|nr:hypothetical protein [Microthrixaceae bacterium]